jgi:hypothetical protein
MFLALLPVKFSEHCPLTWVYSAVTLMFPVLEEHETVMFFMGWNNLQCMHGIALSQREALIPM